MEVILIFLAIVLVTALVLGWLAVCVIATLMRLFLRILTAPFRVARRADAAVYNRLHRSLPRRVYRENDIQCANQGCRARLPAEAKFCARCGGALPQRRALPALAVEVRTHGFSQVT